MKTDKPILAIAFIAISSACFSQNLASSQSWTVGSGSVGVFSENGNDSQNIRELGIGPMGTQTILWKAVADAAYSSDGGWDTNAFAIDNTKMYRFAVWIKKSNSTDGFTYLGCRSNDILDLSGSVNSNPYFWVGGLPSLDKWYLLVGYVHGSGDASTTSYGGIYDGVTGAKVLSTQDFKFSSSATTAVHRAYLYYDVTTSDRQYFYGPEVYKVDQPLTETITPSITSGNVFFGGNVGIGNTSPDAKLAVSGQVHAQEIKVSIAVPGPDYVFEKDYPLTSLEDIKTYIDQNKHLPEVPSAKEMEKNGVQLGEMNMLLLRKIEELTLHLIEQNKFIEQLKEERRVSPDPSGKKIEELTLYVIEQNKRLTNLETENKDLKTLIKK